MAQLDENDEGKTVVDESGETVGLVAEVRTGTAYVEPDPGLTDQLGSILGFNEADEDTFALDDNRIEGIGDREIRIGTSDEI